MPTRPGSQPGPEWMRKLSTSPEGPRRLRKAILRILILFSVIQVASIVAADVAVYRAHGRHVGTYNSPVEIAGMPLLSVGRTAHGVIAYGALSIGRFAYRPGIAFGYHEAGGKQKESLFG